MKKRALIKLLFIIGILIIISGCSKSFSGTQVANNNPINNTTGLEPSFTPIKPEETSVLYSTKTPWPTPSDLPPTLTPLPTFSIIDAQKNLIDLYQNNPCDLPCWWNIVPGESTWNETWQLLERFSSDRFPSESYPDIRIFESEEQPGYVFITTYFDITVDSEDEPYGALKDLSLGVKTIDFVVDYLDVNTGRIANYTIPEIMKKYGEPTQVYVVGAPHSLDFYSGISIWLYYPNFGFISNHFTTVNNTQWSQTSFTSCFQKASKVYIWPQDLQMDFLSRLRISGQTNSQDFKLINEVSDYSVSSFYSQFVREQTQPCLVFYTDKIIK